MKNRKLTRFFVEPGDTFTDQALRQSDCLSDEPDKIVKLSAGEHRLLECLDENAAKFIKATHDGDRRFRMVFWRQVGSDPPKRCRLKPIDFNEEVVLA